MYLHGPETLWPFLGVTIASVSQEQTEFKLSNFTVILLFVTLKTCLKISFPKQAVDSFTSGFSGLLRNWPLRCNSCTVQKMSKPLILFNVVLRMVCLLVILKAFRIWLILEALAGQEMKLT